MRSIAAILGVLAASVVPAGAQSLVCFGNEPSWSVSFISPDRATVVDQRFRSRVFRGHETRNDPLRERVWRGRGGGRRDLVLFLREEPCSDGMSDDKHTVSARVSMPDGSFMAGCCRVPARTSAGTALEGPWRLVDLPGQNLSSLQPPMRGVTAQFERGRISGFAGCNTFTGPYTVSGNRITLGNLAGTMMACPEPAMTIERAFNQALSGTLSYAIEANRLNLRTTSGSVLVFERATSTFNGTTWRVTGYYNGRQAIVSPLSDTQITLSFENGKVIGNAGCNTILGSYVLNGDRISFTPSATTQKMCGEKVMDQERDFITALKSVVRWTGHADQLHLISAGEQRALIATKETALTLYGRTWTVTGFNNGRQAVVSPITGTQLTLSFTQENLSGQAGCNNFRGSFSADGNQIKIGPVATTRKMCATDVMDQESQFLKALEATTKWTIQGNLLDLHFANGERALTATSSPK